MRFGGRVLGWSALVGVEWTYRRRNIRGRPSWDKRGLLDGCYFFKVMGKFKLTWRGVDVGIDCCSSLSVVVGLRGCFQGSPGS